MHKFIEVASGEKENKFHVTHHIFGQNDKRKVTYTLSISKCNKLIEVASGEREKQISCHQTFGHNDKSNKVMKNNLRAED